MSRGSCGGGPQRPKIPQNQDIVVSRVSENFSTVAFTLSISLLDIKFPCTSSVLSMVRSKGSADTCVYVRGVSIGHRSAQRSVLFPGLFNICGSL